MHSKLARKTLQIEKEKQALLASSGNISITKILESEQIQEIIAQCREFRDRVFNPLVTLLLFIKQVLSPDKSCKKAIADFIAEQSCQGNDQFVSANTGPYCKARQRLPKETIQQLVKEVGKKAIENSSPGWKIDGRELKAVDGTTLKMADSEENQQAFP